MSLVPFPVLLPLAAALLLVAFERLLPSRLVDAAALLATAATTVITALLFHEALQAPLVYWFGGWQPDAGVAIGISFVVDPAGSAVAGVASFIFLASMAFGWHYFDELTARFHALMLIFLAAMNGFCLTGDLFNLFVFFELMSVAAFAVTAYKLEASSLEGALNFTVMNMVGSFLLLAGIGVLYGHTGALNLAQLGRSVGASDSAALLGLACVLVFSGLLIKAAIMPFHFWLADAHAVAPTPVCVIFSGIMVPVALFGIARLYWTVFAGVPSLDTFMHSTLLYVGAATAVMGGLMSVAQRHIKRLLAFSTVSHMGVLLCALATLTPGGLSGFLLYLAGHGLVKGALFMIAGILLSGLQSIDEVELRGRARHLRVTAVACVLGGLLLAGLPIGLIASGRALVDHAAQAAHAWLPYALGLGSALTGAAVLRMSGRVFLGLGPDPGAEEQSSRQQEEEKPRPSRLLLVPVIALLMGCLVVQGASVEALAAHAAARLGDHQGYALWVLGGHVTPAQVPEVESSGPALGWLSVSLALGIAAFELNKQHLPRWPQQALGMVIRPLFAQLERIHSGHVGDYVVWMLAGLVVFAVSFL